MDVTEDRFMKEDYLKSFAQYALNVKISGIWDW